jgi:hypothetical protein
MAPPLSNTASKAGKQESHKCPRPLCQRLFLAALHLKIHLSKSTACTNALHFTGDIKVSAANVAHHQDFLEVDEESATGCELNFDNEDVKQPWECVVQPWDSTNEEDSSVDTDATFDSDNSDSHDNVIVDKASQELVTSDGLCFTASNFVETKLLKLLNHAHALHFLYQDVLNWATEAKQLKYGFCPQCTTRKAQIKYIKKLAQLQYCHPETIPLTLPGDGVFIPVTWFPFINMLYSLLGDPKLVSDLSNLHVNPDNPFGKYKSEGDYLTTVNSGAWYQTAYKDLIKDPEKDFLLPISFACNETNLSKTGKTCCWPLLFTTTIFNQKLRNNASAWRPLCYIYDVNIVDSKQERAHQSNEYKGNWLHAIFCTVLESFIEAQNLGLLDNITLTLGGIEWVVNLRIPVIFIIGDMQGGDKMCCLSAGYSNKMSCLCCKCNICGNQSGEPFVKCQQTSMMKILELVSSNNVEALKSVNQYNVHSA